MTKQKLIEALESAISCMDDKFDILMDDGLESEAMEIQQHSDIIATELEVLKNEQKTT